MTGTSCVRAGASCLPIFGPVVSYYNTLNVKRKISLLVEAHPLDRMQLNVLGMQATLCALRGRVDGIVQAQRDLELQRIENRNRHLQAYQNGRIYAICGIIGNVLSIALVVGLIALKIFSVIPGILTIGTFIFQAYFLISNLKMHNKHINVIQNI